MGAEVRDPLDRAFFARSALEVAPDLLGATVVVGARSGRIVEVEAYCGVDDPAAHSYRGPTPRTETMFGVPGHLYVYLSYGIHHCANVVCAPAGTGHAVLLRALEPIAGVEAQRHARGPAARRARDIASGPGKLTMALGIGPDDDGADLVHPDVGGAAHRILLLDGPPPDDVVQTTRVGISRAVEKPWRWFDARSVHVSRR